MMAKSAEYAFSDKYYIFQNSTNQEVKTSIKWNLASLTYIINTLNWHKVIFNQHEICGLREKIMKVK